MNSIFKKNIFVITGGNGFLGRHVVDYFLKKKIPKENIIIPTKKKLDLRIQSNVEKLLRKNQIIIHLASNVGGIGKGLEKDADYFYDNAIMALNLIKIGKDVGIKKFVGVGSILQYPKDAHLPLKEEQIWKGAPLGITAPYSHGKNIMLQSSVYFNNQYNLDCINLILPNLYGPGDDFNPISSHVIASLIQKVYKAKTKKEKHIDVWGDGSISREFVYVKDAAEAIYFATKKNLGIQILNIGSGVSTNISSVINEICTIMNYNGVVNWNHTKQTGVKENYLDISESRKKLKFFCKTGLNHGLKKTIEWYIKNITNHS